MTAAGLDARPGGTRHPGTGPHPARSRLTDGVLRWFTRWAQSRRLAPNSVTGICVALAACAAGWFSGGTAADALAGALALCACYLAWCAARFLAAITPAAAPATDVPGTAPGLPAAAPAAGISAASLVLLSSAVSSAAVYAGLAVGGHEAGMPGMWQLATAAVILLWARDLAMACRGADRGSRQSWAGRTGRAVIAFPFGARVVLIGVAVPLLGARVTLLLLTAWAMLAIGFAIVSPARGDAVSPDREDALQSPAPEPAVPAASSNVTILPADMVPAAAAADIAPAVAVTPAAVPAVAAPAAASAEPGPASAVHASSAATPGTETSRAAEPGTQGAVSEAALAEASTAPMSIGAIADAVAEVPADPGADPGVLYLAADETEVAGGEPAAAEPITEPLATLNDLLEAEPADEPQPAPPQPAPPPGPLLPGMVQACRDDGQVALWLGRLVRGQLVPLPPAIAGLLATVALAVVGMQNLRGLLLLTPLVVMLLAAFGSAHRHDRRLDWLTPAVLLGGQLLYTAAVGFSFGVPAPITFIVCALIGLHCASLASASFASPGNSSPASTSRGRGGVGWEGRMLIVGVGAMAGVPAIAFVVLGGYLALGASSRILPRYARLPQS